MFWLVCVESETMEVSEEEEDEEEEEELLEESEFCGETSFTNCSRR